MGIHSDEKAVAPPKREIVYLCARLDSAFRAFWTLQDARIACLMALLGPASLKKHDRRFSLLQEKTKSWAFFVAQRKTFSGPKAFQRTLRQLSSSRELKEMLDLLYPMLKIHPAHCTGYDLPVEPANDRIYVTRRALKSHVFVNSRDAVIFRIISDLSTRKWILTEDEDDYKFRGLSAMQRDFVELIRLNPAWARISDLNDPLLPVLLKAHSQADLDEVLQFVDLMSAPRPPVPIFSVSVC